MRHLPFALSVCRALTLAFAVLLFPLGATAEEPASPQPTTPDAQLIIRNISIVIGDVFEGDDIGAFYRTVNNLKINTKEWIIRRELKFREGDVYDQFVIDESARYLRALPFLRKVSITTSREGDSIDVVVYAQDIWTLIPNVSFSIGGGRDKKSVGLAEGNLLGYGKRVEAFYGEEDGRKTIEGVYDDSRFFGTYQRLLLGQFVRSDGFRTIGFWGQPFRTLVDPFAWQTYADVSDTVGRLFEFGDERFVFRQKHEQVGGAYTFAVGDPETFRQRISFGYEYLADTFDDADEQDFDDVDVNPDSVSHDPALLAEDRRFSGPVFMYEHIHPDFISMNYIDRFDRVQDFNLGEEFSARGHLAAAALGSNDDVFLLNLSERQGVRFSDESFLRGELGGSTRARGHGFDNDFLRGELKFFDVLGTAYVGGMYLGKHTFMTSMSVEYGQDLDKDRELLLGAENGLRGYKDRFFTGDKRFLLNIEDRIHMIEDIYKLISLGAVVFADVGGATDDAFSELFADRIYSDIGIGFRLYFPRSTGGGIVRVDLAFPLREVEEDGVKRFEPRLVISTGQLVNARLRAETLGIDKANVSVGQDR